MAWLQSRIGALTPVAKGIAAIRPNGTTAGVVGFDMWTPASAHVHVAMDTATACRSLLRPAFAYPFGELELGVLLCTIPSHRCRAIRMAHRLGFRESHRIRHGYAHGSDLVSFEMRKENCPWILGQAKAA
jgi:hypothetical protein